MIKIRKTPKYMLNKIQKIDKEYYPKPDGHNRFYKYYTIQHKQLCEITVAVRNKYKKWYCKQVVVHAIHSKKVFLQDIGQSMGYLLVGWYREKLTSYPKWYDYDWGYNDDKYFQMTTAKTINKEFILTLPQYKYSAVDKYEYSDVMNYLRFYEKYPKAELLVKAGLSKLATSKLILRQCDKDKNFCKWLYEHRQEAIECYYVTSIIKAYKQKKSIKEVYNFDRLIKEFNQRNNYRAIKEMLKANEKIKFINYLNKQKIDAYLYNDYLSACTYLGLDMTIDKNRYPHEFMRWHDIRIDEMHSKQTELDKIKRKELYDTFAQVSTKYEALQRQLKDSYITLIARSPKDLINEGDKLHHCVGRMGYDEKFAREETLIFFVRTKEQPDIPLVTLEYSPSKHIILQCYADHDTKPSEEILNYVNKIWLPYANRKVRKVA